MDSLKAWIVAAVGLSFGAGLAAGVAGTTTLGAGTRAAGAARRGDFVLYDELLALDARQARLLRVILEKYDEENRDLLDRQVLPEMLQDQRDAIGRKTDERIYKILDPRQRAIYDRSQTLAGARAR
jgi:hypothetical protein